MPRIPKPFRWREGWYTDAGGERKLLLPKTATFTAAQTALRHLLNDRDHNGGRPSPNHSRGGFWAPHSSQAVMLAHVGYLNALRQLHPTFQRPR